MCVRKAASGIRSGTLHPLCLLTGHALRSVRVNDGMGRCVRCCEVTQLRCRRGGGGGARLTRMYTVGVVGPALEMCR